MIGVTSCNRILAWCSIGHGSSAAYRISWCAVSRHLAGQCTVREKIIGVGSQCLLCESFRTQHEARVDRRHAPHYTSRVIKTFADRRTKELYENGKSKRFPPEVWERAVRKLEYLDLATSVNDLRVPPSNRLHRLDRDRVGQYSISVNDQWRICFRFEDGDVCDVEITDYH